MQSGSSGLLPKQWYHYYANEHILSGKLVLELGELVVGLDCQRFSHTVAFDEPSSPTKVRQQEGIS